MPSVSHAASVCPGCWPTPPPPPRPRQLHEGDAYDERNRPPPNYDGTPNESVADVLARGRQLLSITETQYRWG